MTNTPMEMLVFKDGEGRYYVLSRQAWEQARVPDERRHEVDALLAGGAGKSVTVGKLADLPPRDLAAVRGGAQVVGSFRTSAPLSTSPHAKDWSPAP